ncbi:MAG: HlyD family secretion protein [bacterium]
MRQRRRSSVSFLLVPLIFLACGNGEANRFTASGIVEGTSVKVAAQTGGLILELYFDEGQDIARDQVIAVIDTEKLVYQWQQIQAALEEVSVQQKINVNIQAKAQADFDHIDKKYQRYQELYRKKSVSEQLLDDLKQAYHAAKTQLENSQQNLRLVESKQKGLQAQSKLLRRQIRDATITAPLSGTVTTKYYEAGETVPTGAPVVEIIDLEKMWTKVYVSETLLAKIKVGQQVEIRIDGTAKTLAGRVSWISPKAEFTPKNILTDENRTSLVYAVKVDIDNPDKLLKHGMPVEVALTF